jgi:importin subunit alpha-6/7
MLSVERDPPIQQCIDAGLVPAFINYLQAHEYPKLQFEAAWALTNIASGSTEQTHFVIRSGAVPLLIQLLMSQDVQVREQAIWAIGNISGESAECRDHILAQGALAPLIQCIMFESAPITTYRTGTWAISNLCRGKPAPALELVKPALGPLGKMLNMTDDEVLADACWAISYISDGNDERLKAVLESNIARRLVELLLHRNVAVQTPALRSIGNLVTGEDKETQIVINARVLSALKELLNHPRKGIRKEACWAISNITAGSKAQVQATLDSGIMEPLIEMLQNGDYEIKKEASWAVSNCTSYKQSDHIRTLVNLGAIESVSEMLDCGDSRITLVCLEAIANILKTGANEAAKSGSTNRYVSAIEEYAIDKIEELQDHKNDEVAELCSKIIVKYFSVEEEDDQNMTPNVSSGQQQFAFGMGSQATAGVFSF